MRQLFLLSALIILALISAAFLSIPVFRLLQIYSEVPFHKVISQLSSLCGLLFIFLYLKINSILDLDTAGFSTSRNHTMQEILTGAGAGIIIILVLETVLLLLRVHIPEPEMTPGFRFISLIIIKALIAGIMVALVEEILYRGALLGGLYKTTGVFNAVFFSSIIYSAVHFIKFPRLPADADLGWQTGLESLTGAFYRFSDPAILDSFLALFAFGVLLAMVRLNKGNIFQCIGLHAGVVMAIKFTNELTDYNFDTRYEFLVNRYDHQLGYLAFIWLCVLIFFYYRTILFIKRID